uniref:non-specific serine/threonine protein kinase n=1 Tax=Otus sunia TaxID=257818 RepID=A0A8C8E6N8_9STRI
GSHPTPMTPPHTSMGPTPQIYGSCPTHLWIYGSHPTPIALPHPSMGPAPQIYGSGPTPLSPPQVRSRSDGRLYALKRSLRPFRGPRDRRRQLLEARAQAAVGQHPHVLPLLGGWVGGGRLHLLTPWCPRGSLGGLWGRPVAEWRLWGYLWDLLLALGHLQRRALAHLDLRPPNVLLTHGGCRLGDFGTAAPLMELGSDPQMALGSDPLMELGSDPLMGPDPLQTLPSAPLMELGSNPQPPHSSGPLWSLPSDPLMTLPSDPQLPHSSDPLTALGSDPQMAPDPQLPHSSDPQMAPDPLQTLPSAPLMALSSDPQLPLCPDPLQTLPSAPQMAPDP